MDETGAERVSPTTWYFPTQFFQPDIYINDADIGTLGNDTADKGTLDNDVADNIWNYNTRDVFRLFRHLEVFLPPTADYSISSYRGKSFGPVRNNDDVAPSQTPQDNGVQQKKNAADDGEGERVEVVVALVPPPSIADLDENIAPRLQLSTEAQQQLAAKLRQLCWLTTAPEPTGIYQLTPLCQIAQLSYPLFWLEAVLPSLIQLCNAQNILPHLYENGVVYVDLRVSTLFNYEELYYQADAALEELLARCYRDGIMQMTRGQARRWGCTKFTADLYRLQRPVAFARLPLLLNCLAGRPIAFAVGPNRLIWHVVATRCALFNTQSLPTFYREHLQLQLRSADDYELLSELQELIFAARGTVTLTVLASPISHNLPTTTPPTIVYRELLVTGAEQWWQSILQ